MAQAGTIQTSRQGRPLWISWLGVLGLLVVSFGVVWFTLAIFASATSTAGETSRSTSDGAFGFSTAEWSESFSLTLNRSLLLTATLPAACVLGLVLGFVLRWAKGHRSRTKASAGA